MYAQTGVCVQYGLVAPYVINVLKYYDWEYGEAFSSGYVFAF